MSTEGRQIGDKFRTLNQIGQGDLASVYLAEDTESGEVCTLRLFKWEFSSDGSFANLLKQEAASLEKLHHPNIMPAGTVEQTRKGQVYAVRHFVEGRNLEDVMRLESPLGLRRACTIGRQVASALEAAHNAGILHGDLKPANILLLDEENGTEAVRVLGFGTFSLKQDRFMDLAHLALLEPGHLIGSASYISPERAIGTEPDALDGRSDLYSLGVILYEMLSGEAPFRGGNPMEVLLEHLFAEPKPLCERPELGIPEVLDSLILRTLAKNRKERPPSATVLVDQLQAWAKYEALSASSGMPSSPAEERVESPKGAGEPDPVSRLPFRQVPKMQPPDSAPTVQLPIREIAARQRQEDVLPPEPLWSSAPTSFTAPGSPSGAESSIVVPNAFQSQDSFGTEFESPEKPDEEPEWFSRLPFVFTPKSQATELAPTVQLPAHDIAASVPDQQQAPAEPSWFSSGAASEQHPAAASVSFSAPSAGAAPPPGSEVAQEALWPSEEEANSELKGPSLSPNFPAPQAPATSEPEFSQNRGSRTGSFVADFQPSRLDDSDQAEPAPLLETESPAPNSGEPERNAVGSHTFLADLQPDLLIDEARRAIRPIGDVTLESRAASNPAPSEVATASRNAGPRIAQQNRGDGLASPARRGHPLWIAVILVIVILAAGASGWLYYSGRTYWFQPQYVISHVSALFSPESTGPAPSAQSPETQAAPVTPSGSAASSARPPAAAGPARASSTAASGPGATAHAVGSPGSAEAGTTSSSIQALQLPRPSQALKHLPIVKPRVRPRHQATEDSAAVEDAIRRGNYYFLLGRYDAAIRVYDAALKQNPANPKLLGEIARARRAKTAEAEFLGR